MVITPEELKRRRIDLGMTQKRLSDAIHVSQSILSKFESKKNFPGYNAIKQIEENILKLEHTKEKRVDSIMSRHVCSFEPDDLVKDVVRAFKSKGYSQAPVLDNGRVVGLVTARGLLDATQSESISNILEPEPPMISKDSPISSAKALLKAFSIVLVNDKGKIVGVISREDVL